MTWTSKERAASTQEGQVPEVGCVHDTVVNNNNNDRLVTPSGAHLQSAGKGNAWQVVAYGKLLEELTERGS